MSGRYTRTSSKYSLITDSGPYEAIVVNNLDTRYSGTLEVEILKYTGGSNTPEKSGQLFTVRYLSPFYGVTPSDGLQDNDGYQNTQKSYGFWAVPPDIGTKVLVVFAEGNANYGYWIGCIQDDYMNFMVPDGKAATTRTTDGTPGDFKESKLPVGEYNKLTETGEDVDPTLFKKPYNKDFTSVLEVQGLEKDEARGLTTTSARRDIPSMVFGWSTPGPYDKRKGNPRVNVGPKGKKANMPYNRLGGSSFVMDDGNDRLIRATHAEEGPPFYINRLSKEKAGDETIPHNELIRLRTRTGHQILLHNSEDLIYIGNSRGTSWIEMTSDGKIDIHAQDSVSVMTNNDLNFTAERDVNIEAGRNVNIKATARWSDGAHYLDNKESGRVQIESVWDTNLFVKHDYKLTVKGNRDVSVDLDSNTTVKQSYHLHSLQNINTLSDRATHMHSTTSFYRTSDKSIHDRATKSYMLKAKNKHLTVDENYKKTVGNLHSEKINGSVQTTVTNSITRQVTGGSIYDQASDAIHMLGGELIAGDAGQIHLNSGLAEEGTPAETSKIALQAEKALDAERVQMISTIALPFVTPGVDKPVKYESILTRAPQHEPWPHHENMNPQGFKIEETDREDPGMLPLADRIEAPDVFLKNKDGQGFSRTVLSSNNIQGFDGGTGDSSISNGQESKTLRDIDETSMEIDYSRGNPSDITQTFFKGDGQLKAVTSSSGKTAMVAEKFHENFQGFIDDLEATGYQIKTLLGYAKRQTISGSSWSLHASGAAIDINPPNPVMNTYPNGFYSPRPRNAPMTDMPSNTGELARKHGLGWGGAWRSVDDAMHFSAHKSEGGAYGFTKGYIPLGPSEQRTDEVPPRTEEELEIPDPSNIDDTNLPGPQNADGTPNKNEEE